MIEKCIECGEPAEWVRSTQFAGEHPYCKFHAEKESDFYQEPDSYFFWYKLDLQDESQYNIPMTNEEVEKFYNELVEFYGESLANFEHYPKQFANQVKLYRYYKEKKNEDRSMQ